MDKANSLSQEAQPFSKILFRVPMPDGGEISETLWAIDLGGDRYQVANIPLLAKSVSLDDTIYAPHGMEGKYSCPIYQHVIEKSGNRTIRIAFEPPRKKGNASDKTLQKLLSLGCSSEGGIGGIICMNVPPGIDLDAIGRYLVKRKVQCELADPTYEELYPADNQLGGQNQ